MTPVDSAPAVRVLGSDRCATAFSRVNAAWRRGLAAAGIDLVDDDRADVLVHHDYSVRFGDVALPDARVRAAARPWDFGPYPARWASVIAHEYDELWTFTSWGRKCAIAGGVPPPRVRVIPLGVDVGTFTAHGPAHEVTSHARFTFLFVGAATYRKGIDLLLRAFVDAFDEHDDVQLVVKDHTADLFYTGLSARSEIAAAAKAPGAARIHYIDTYMPVGELASLYRGSDCLVLPSRAEGWALPVLEAMACGTPAIVPSFGAFLDYCDGAAARLVPTRRVRLPAGRHFAVNTLGFREHVESVDFCETSAGLIGRAMRDAFEEPASARATRAAAARRLAEGYEWAHSVSHVIHAVESLCGNRT
jgi:glycosyltransferase involved in cell wall biosynthesis